MVTSMELEPVAADLCQRRPAPPLSVLAQMPAVAASLEAPVLAAVQMLRHVGQRNIERPRDVARFRAWVRPQVLGDLVAAETTRAGTGRNGGRPLAGESLPGGREPRAFLDEGIVRREFAVEDGEPLVDLAQDGTRAAGIFAAPAPLALGTISHTHTLPAQITPRPSQRRYT
jgi:hypothetical protein